MNTREQNLIGCDGFEENLSDYLENSIAAGLRKPMAEHSLKCPLCHSLMNEVKEAVEVCRELATPAAAMTSLEARILSATMPESGMPCTEFEEHLTDYLDGFLPAGLFHRWERHAAVCHTCTNLPGAVVRSIAACYTYKVEELPLPAGLHDQILKATIGTAEVNLVKPSWTSQAGDWLRGLSFPITVPQLAPIAMMLLVVVLTFSQIGGESFGGMYQKGFELAGQTYKQGADIVLRNKAAAQQNTDDSSGTGGNNK